MSETMSLHSSVAWVAVSAVLLLAPCLAWLVLRQMCATNAATDPSEGQSSDETRKHMRHGTRVYGGGGGGGGDGDGGNDDDTGMYAGEKDDMHPTYPGAGGQWLRPNRLGEGGSGMRPTYPGENGGGVRPTPSYFGAVSSGTNQMRGYVGHLRGATSRSLGRTHDVELINLTSLPFQCDVMHGGLCTNDKNVTLKAGEKRRFGTLCSTTSVVVRRVQEKTVLPAPDRHDSPTAIDVRLDPVTGALVVQVQAVSRGMGRRTRGGLLGISADVIVNNSTPVAVRCQVKVGVLCRDKDEMVAANSVANIVNDCAPEQIHITLVQSAVLSPVPRGSTFTAKLLEVTEANGVLKINAGGEATRGMQARTRGGVGGAANNVDLHNDTQVAISGKIEVPSVFCANKAFTLAPGAAMTIVNNCEPSRVVFDRPTKDAFVIPQAKHHPGRAAKMTLQEEGGGGFVMRTDAGTVSPYVAPPPPPPVTNDVLLQNNLPVTVSGQIYVTNCQNEPFSLDPGQQYHFSARTPCLALQVMLDNPSRMGFNVPRGRRQALVTLEQQGGQWVMRTDAGTEKART